MPVVPAAFPPANPQTVLRLGFVRYLYQLALQQSEQPEPMATASVLTFHDSADLFMQWSQRP